jgi:hypothetical protein
MSLLGIIASQNYPRTFTVDFLVVAGGGGGAENESGGGGAAALTDSDFFLVTQIMQ